jgi:S-DNA-T family DNA segregation ATPase FtsK/SpoIIIE
LARSKSKSNATKGKKDEKTVNPDIVGIAYIATGIILGIAIYSSLAGILSALAQRISYAVIGIGANVLPIYLIYFGFQYIKTRGDIKFNKTFIGVTILVAVVMLVFGTINIQSLDIESDFFENIKLLISDNNDMHGGIISYLICYPLYKAIGALGTYIILLAFSIIAIILVFDITLYDLGLKAYNKGEKIRENRNKKLMEREEIQEKQKRENFINIVEKDDNEPKSQNEKEAFLSGVNKKIKILDFMKETGEDDEIKPQVKSEISSDIQIDSFLEKNTQNHGRKKESLDNEVKDVVNKEIQEQMSEQKELREYKHPSVELLKLNANTKLNSSDKKELIENANKLEEILSNFGVDAKVTQVTKGPSVTRFELQPSPGVKVSKIVNLADDIALGLAASGIRIEAPIPGKAAVGIEVPNGKQTPVFLREVLENDEFINSKKKLAFALGKDISGKTIR